MKSVALSIIEQAEADRKKYGYKELYICSNGLIYKIDEILSDGFINQSGVIFSFVAITPVFPISQKDGEMMKQKESGIIQMNKNLIIPKPN